MFSSVSVCDGPGASASVVGSYAYNDAALVDIINFASGSRSLRWRADLLNNNRTYKGDITPLVSKLSIQYDTSRPVKRTLDIDMVETVASQTVTIEGSTITGAGVNYLYDLVRPVCLIGVPGTTHWIHVPCGIFRFSRPAVAVPGYAVTRHATMPDLTSIVQENSATDFVSSGAPTPLTIPAGYKVLDAIRVLLTNAPSSVYDGTVFTMPGCALGDLLPAGSFTGALSGNTPSDWPSSSTAPYDALIPDGGYQISEGTSYLDVINHLAYTIGLNDLMADERGILRLYPWPVRAPSYTLPSPLYTYDTRSDSIVQFGVTEDIMLDDVGNVVEVIVEDTQRQPFYAVVTNVDPNSPYSVANLGRRVVKTVRDAQVPSASSSAPTGTSAYVEAYALDQLVRASWLTDKVSLPIAVNPLHCGGPDQDAISLAIYQTHVEAGVGVDDPVIIGFTISGGPSYPPLVVTETFLIDSWIITATLAQPGSTSNLTGNVGITTILEPREGKQGHSMVVSCHRITSTFDPSNPSNYVMQS